MDIFKYLDLIHYKQEKIYLAEQKAAEDAGL